MASVVRGSRVGVAGTGSQWGSRRVGESWVWGDAIISVTILNNNNMRYVWVSGVRHWGQVCLVWDGSRWGREQGSVTSSEFELVGATGEWGEGVERGVNPGYPIIRNRKHVCVSEGGGPRGVGGDGEGLGSQYTGTTSSNSKLVPPTYYKT